MASRSRRSGWRWLVRRSSFCGNVVFSRCGWFYHKGDAARIEVAVDQLAKFADEPFRREVVEHFKTLGFKYVAHRPGGFS